MNEATKQSNEQRYFDALKVVAGYETPERLKRTAEKRYGLTGEEALEMAYENMREWAIQAIRGKRRPKQ